jgi:PAS domain S-box-containing protein
MLINLDGRTTYVSPSIEQLLGYTPGEALNLRYRDAMKPHSLQDVMGFLQNHIWNGNIDRYNFSESRVLELEMIRKDGTDRWAEIKFKVQTGEDGRPENIVGVLRDIHERKLTELALRDSESMFRLLTENVNDVILLT